MRGTFSAIGCFLFAAACATNAGSPTDTTGTADPTSDTASDPSASSNGTDSSPTSDPGKPGNGSGSGSSTTSGTTTTGSTTTTTTTTVAGNGAGPYFTKPMFFNRDVSASPKAANSASLIATLKGQG